MMVQQDLAFAIAILSRPIKKFTRILGSALMPPAPILSNLFIQKYNAGLLDLAVLYYRFEIFGIEAFNANLATCLLGIF